jgi:hypothetical protein
MHWWLPNDEGYPPIIRSIRKFVEERTSPARSVDTEDLRDMKAIFASLKLDDGKSSMPPNMDKGKGPATDVAVAAGEDWGASHIGPATMQDTGLMDLGEGDAYGLRFDDGNGSWAAGQGGGTYVMPKPGGFL